MASALLLLFFFCCLLHSLWAYPAICSIHRTVALTGVEMCACELGIGAVLITCNFIMFNQSGRFIIHFRKTRSYPVNYSTYKRYSFVRTSAIQSNWMDFIGFHWFAERICNCIRNNRLKKFFYMPIECRSALTSYIFYLNCKYKAKYYKCFLLNSHFSI